VKFDCEDIQVRKCKNKPIRKVIAKVEITYNKPKKSASLL